MADNSALLIWQKLLPVADNSDIAESLRCEIRDPLWLLARQWQMGEFNAEDAGMAAFASGVTISSPLQRWMPSGATTGSGYQWQEMPLNALVEKTTPSFDLSLRLESGRYWKKLLTQAGKGTLWDKFVKNPQLQFSIPIMKYQPEDEAMTAFNYEPYEQLTAALKNGRMVDGAGLYAALRSQKASALLGQADPQVDDLGNKWLLWVQQRLGVSSAPPPGSWEAGGLQYKAKLSAALPGNAVACLQLPEHNGVAMDSWSWQQDQPLKEMAGNLDPGLIVTQGSTFIPAQVSFPSMPSARWWELEDSTIDLSSLQANTTDLGLLILSEFGLMYSGDWLLTPLVLPVGHIHQIRSMRVTDVFGVQSYVHAAPQNNNWELFQMDVPEIPVTATAPSPKGWLHLPAVTPSYLQGEIEEEIHFLRDEMANLVWGVEMTVPDGTGNGADGRNAALRMENWLKTLAATGAGTGGDTPLPDIGADLAYSIGNTVPANWIPFIPLRETNNSAQISFCRAAMPRFNSKYAPSRIHPRTNVLRSSTDDKGHYNIREEVIPATGLTIRQMWRRTRWFDGRTITWLAREKKIGRYMESSGLQFDLITPASSPAPNVPKTS